MERDRAHSGRKPLPHAGPRARIAVLASDSHELALSRVPHVDTVRLLCPPAVIDKIRLDRFQRIISPDGFEWFRGTWRQYGGPSIRYFPLAKEPFQIEFSTKALGYQYLSGLDRANAARFFRSLAESSAGAFRFNVQPLLHASRLSRVDFALDVRLGEAASSFLAFMQRRVLYNRWKRLVRSRYVAFHCRDRSLRFYDKSTEFNESKRPGSRKLRTTLGMLPSGLVRLEASLLRSSAIRTTYGRSLCLAETLDPALAWKCLSSLVSNLRFASSGSVDIAHSIYDLADRIRLSPERNEYHNVVTTFGKAALFEALADPVNPHDWLQRAGRTRATKTEAELVGSAAAAVRSMGHGDRIQWLAILNQVMQCEDPGVIEARAAELGLVIETRGSPESPAHLESL